MGSCSTSKLQDKEAKNFMEKKWYFPMVVIPEKINTMFIV